MVDRCQRVNDQEATMLQIDASKRHVHINFRNNGRKLGVFHSTEDQLDYRHSNVEISTARISAAEMGTRRVRIANLSPDVLDGVWSTTDASVWVRKSNGLSSGNMTPSIPSPVGQRHSTRNDYSRQTHYRGWQHGAGVIRWTPYDVLWL